MFCQKKIDKMIEWVIKAIKVVYGYTVAINYLHASCLVFSCQLAVMPRKKAPHNLLYWVRYMARRTDKVACHVTDLTNDTLS